MRVANLGDLGAITASLKDLQGRSTAAHMKYTDLAVARRYLKEAIYEKRVWFVGGYMILVEVGSEWYTNKTFLIEKIILKVYPDFPEVKVQDAVAALDKLREMFGCVMIAAGDTQIGYMLPIYEAQGYKVLGTQLVKEP